jgi:hypothetical protein
LKKPFGPEEIEVQDYNTGKRTDSETEKESATDGKKRKR